MLVTVAHLYWHMVDSHHTIWMISTGRMATIILVNSAQPISLGGAREVGTVGVVSFRRSLWGHLKKGEMRYSNTE